MTSSSSHDFDPITEKDIEDFSYGLEHDTPIEIIQIEMAKRAVGDTLQVIKYNANRVTGATDIDPEVVELISTALNTHRDSNDHLKIAKYPPDSTE